MQNFLALRGSDRSALARAPSHARTYMLVFLAAAYFAAAAALALPFAR